MIHSNLQRNDKTKPVLLIDFDQTIRNGGGTNGKIIRVLYEVLNERGMDEKTIQRISHQATREKRYGTYNYILSLCGKDVKEFNEMCSEIFNRVDYSNVRRDEKLFKLLKKASKKYNLYILTNSHRTHVDICCKILFGVGIDDMEFIKCFDITETYENGRFLRKQDENGLEKVCERIEANMSECILIDDNKGNIITAKSKGMRAIHVKKNKLTLHHILKVLNNI